MPITEPWTTSVPEWYAASSNPSLGNGTLELVQRRFDETLLLRLTLLTGSSTSYGSGRWIFDIGRLLSTTEPERPSALTVVPPNAIVPAVAVTAAGVRYGGFAEVTFDVDFLVFSPVDGPQPVEIMPYFDHDGDGVASRASSTVPFAWAAGCSLVIGSAMRAVGN